MPGWIPASPLSPAAAGKPDAGERHGERKQLQLRERADDFAQVANLVGDKQRNVGLHLLDRPGRILREVGQISCQGLVDLGDPIYVPTQLRRIAPVIVDNSSVVVPAVPGVLVPRIAVSIGGADSAAGVEASSAPETSW